MEIKRYKITHLKNSVDWHFGRYEMARLVLEGKTMHLTIERATQMYNEEKKVLDTVLNGLC